MKHVLTIAGSDPSGGAGIQADLKTMCALGVYGMSAITALTVQNSREVRAVESVDPALVAGQIDAVFDDIRVDAVKVGMIVNHDIAKAVAECLARRKAKNIVVDPVMVSKSGGRLIDEDAVKETLRIARTAAITTPNLREAGLLAGYAIRDHAGMERAVESIREQGVRAVLIKGGGLAGSADDLLALGNEKIWLRSARVPTGNVHGAGCTLSSAIACGLAAGKSVRDAVGDAKRFVTLALENSFKVGGGPGPLGHMVDVCRRAGVRVD